MESGRTARFHVAEIMDHRIAPQPGENWRSVTFDAVWVLNRTTGQLTKTQKLACFTNCRSGPNGQRADMDGRWLLHPPPTNVDAAGPPPALLVCSKATISRAASAEFVTNLSADGLRIVYSIYLRGHTSLAGDGWMCQARLPKLMLGLEAGPSFRRPRT